MTTIFFVATETSGDIHGANLARQLKAIDPTIRLVGAGGSHMREAGVEILIDPTSHATVGVVEAVRHIGRYAQIYRLLQSSLRTWLPDAVVLIDSPDFNLRFAGRVKDHGIPVIYYISPQIWAWRKGRIKTIRKVVTKMLVILDFEEKLYRDAGVDVAFVGHPLLDAYKDIDREAVRKEFGAKKLLIGLLPGSRGKQFRLLFPVLKKTAELIQKELPEATFILGCAPNINPKLAQGHGINVAVNRTPEVMAASDLLIVASGTATLEAGIYGTPMIVTYKLNPVTAYLFGPLVWLNTKNFSLINIVAGKEIVPEMYQAKSKPELLAKQAVSMIRDGRLPEIRKALGEVRRKLGQPGASKRAAEEILKTIRKR
ncbi:MAG TPA: lipid-A-disaccharide synthase [Planctomycetota bacterium]|nr:lipid-A-disaccharide synthase [Planctomycetota bacterium]